MVGVMVFYLVGAAVTAVAFVEIVWEEPDDVWLWFIYAACITLWPATWLLAWKSR